MNCQTILTNLVPFWYEAKIEAIIAETLDNVSKEDYNKLIETGGELPKSLLAIREYQKMSQEVYGDMLREETLEEEQINTSPNTVINDVIYLLIKSQKVVVKERKQIKGKKFPPKYCINTSVKDVKNYLEECQKTKKINIFNVKDFMVTYLRGKKGGEVSRSFITEEYNKRKECK